MSKGRRCDVCHGWLDGDVLRDAEHLFSVEHERALRVAAEWWTERGITRFIPSPAFYEEARAEIAARRRTQP